MANWADTTYHITGKKEDVKQLYELIEKFTNKEREPMNEGADPTWQGNILLALGIDIKGSYLRGFFKYTDFDGETLTIDADEAWEVTDFAMLLQSHYKDMEILFSSEELGNEYFVTNDKDGKVFPWRFAVYASIDGDNEMEEFESEEKALQFVANLLERDNITRKEIDEWNEQHGHEEDEEENSIGFYEFKIVD